MKSQTSEKMNKPPKWVATQRKSICTPVTATTLSLAAEAVT